MLIIYISQYFLRATKHYTIALLKNRNHDTQVVLGLLVNKGVMFRLDTPPTIPHINKKK